MQKELIDRTINKHYSYLVNYSKIHIIKFNHSNYQAEELVSLCYDYLINSKFNYDEETDVLKMAQYWIKKQLGWNTSPINYKKKKSLNINYNVDLSITEVASYDSFLSVELITELTDEFFKDKSSYIKQLWQIYYIKEINTASKMAEYLNMSRTTGYNTLKECKEIEQDFKKYIINNLENTY